MNAFGKRETKQDVLNAICEALRHTDNAGDPMSNPLKEIRYLGYGVPDNATLSSCVHDGRTMCEIARPIFEDGTGENGYYDVNITGDSGTTIFREIANHFISKVW